MPKKIKRTPPSRLRYEKAKPTVSARMPEQKRVKLKASLKTMGLSLSKVLTLLADELEIKAKPIEALRLESFETGYQKARMKYQVVYYCAECKRRVIVLSADDKQAISEFIREQQWCCDSCNRLNSN
jgi:hypothetical protein